VSFGRNETNWRTQGDDLRTFLDDFEASLTQVELPTRFGLYPLRETFARF